MILETMILLEENIEINLDLSLDNNFLNMAFEPQKVQFETYIKLKVLLYSKTFINKVGKQLMEWKYIFPNCIFDKELLSEIYKVHINS